LANTFSSCCLVPIEGRLSAGFGCAKKTLDMEPCLCTSCRLVDSCEFHQTLLEERMVSFERMKRADQADWEVLGRLTGLHKKSSVTAADKTKGFSLERFGFCAAFRQVGTGANLLQSLKQYQELLRLGPQNQVHFHTFSLNIDSDSCCRCQEGHNSHSRPGDCFQCLCLDISCQKLGTSEFFQHQLKV